MAPDSLRTGLDVPGRPLTYYLLVLRRRWVYPAVGALLGLIIAMSYLGLRPPSVTATSVVELNVVTNDPFGLDRAPSSLLDVGTERQVARSYLVASRAAEELQGPTAAEVRRATEVTIQPEATIVTISYTSRSPDTARAGADAVASSYLAVRGEQVATRLDDQLGAIEERLIELQAEQTQMLDAAGEARDVDPVAESRQQQVRQELLVLVQQRTALNAISTSGGRLLTPAQYTEVSTFPGRSTAAAGGMLVGALVGGCLAFVRQLARHQVLSATEVEGLTQRPVWQATSATWTDQWAMASQLVVGALPGKTRELVLVSLTSERATEDLVRSLSSAIAADPSVSSSVRKVALAGAVEVTDVAAIRQADAAVLAIDPSTTDRSVSEIAMVLDELQTPLLGTFWCVRARGAHDGRQRVASRKGLTADLGRSTTTPEEARG